MSNLHFTLVSDGPSDKRLIALLKWLLRQHLSGWAINEYFADLRFLPNPPRTLKEKVRTAFDLNNRCEILFIHRDAENQTVTQRITEIEEAIRDLELPKTIYVIPVRMQEAWLLIDENAIRKAAGNPNGTVQLDLPRLTELESIPRPEKKLEDLLILASDASGRRLKKFKASIGQSVYKVAENIEDYSALRSLSAFKQLENDIITFTAHRT